MNLFAHQAALQTQEKTVTPADPRTASGLVYPSWDLLGKHRRQYRNLTVHSMAVYCHTISMTYLVF